MGQEEARKIGDCWSDPYSLGLFHERLGAARQEVVTFGAFLVLLEPAHRRHQRRDLPRFALVDAVLLDPVGDAVGHQEACATPGVTGLEHTASSTNLRLVQHGRPAAPLLLAAGELTSASWSVADVPVWLDPMAPLILDFALAPANGQRTRDIPLPPGLSGTRLGLQSFELLPSGELLGSNATHVVIP